MERGFDWAPDDYVIKPSAHANWYGGLPRYCPAGSRHDDGPYDDGPYDDGPCDHGQHDRRRGKKERGLAMPSFITVRFLLAVIIIGATVALALLLLVVVFRTARFLLGRRRRARVESQVRPAMLQAIAGEGVDTELVHARGGRGRAVDRLAFAYLARVRGEGHDLLADLLEQRGVISRVIRRSAWPGPNWRAAAASRLGLIASTEADPSVSFRNGARGQQHPGADRGRPRAGEGGHRRGRGHPAQPARSGRSGAGRDRGIGPAGTWSRSSPGPAPHPRVRESRRRAPPRDGGRRPWPARYDARLGGPDQVRPRSGTAGSRQRRACAGTARCAPGRRCAQPVPGARRGR